MKIEKVVGVALFDNNNVILQSKIDCNDTSYIYEAANNLSIINGVKFQTIKVQGFDAWDWENMTSYLINTNILNSKFEPYSTVVLKEETKDWRLFEGVTLSERQPEYTATYMLELSKSNNTNSVYFSLYNKEFDSNGKLSPLGLFGCIEISHGVPSVSLGSSENDIGLMIYSDSCGKLAVVKNCDSDSVEFGPVDFIDAKYSGHLFQSEPLNEELNEAREYFSEKLFSQYDFKTFVVKDDSGWVVQDNQWIKTIFLEQDSMEQSVKRYFKVVFFNRSIQVKSVEIMQSIEFTNENPSTQTITWYSSKDMQQLIRSISNMINKSGDSNHVEIELDDTDFDTSGASLKANLVLTGTTLAIRYNLAESGIPFSRNITNSRYLIGGLERNIDLEVDPKVLPASITDRPNKIDKSEITESLSMIAIDRAVNEDWLDEVTVNLDLSEGQQKLIQDITKLLKESKFDGAIRIPTANFEMVNVDIDPYLAHIVVTAKERFLEIADFEMGSSCNSIAFTKNF